MKNRNLGKAVARVAAIAVAMIAIQVVFALDNPVAANCKYKFSKTKECAPIQSLSIDYIDFEVAAGNTTYRDGTSYPACGGRLYIGGGNVGQLADLNLPTRVKFGDPFGRYHIMKPSAIRPGALWIGSAIIEYRDNNFRRLYVNDLPAEVFMEGFEDSSDDESGKRPHSRYWWIDFDEDHRSIPVGITIFHSRYGNVGYDSVYVPVPNALLGIDSALVECRKELLARADTKVQDFIHRQNIATAEAKIAGATARKAYYESQMAPLQAQIDELQAIIPSVLAALEDAADAQQRLLERKAEYVRLMEEFALAESEHYARLFLAVESAQQAIAISLTNVEQNRVQIQSDIDGINLMIAEINADVEEASNNLREAEQDLEELTNQ